MKSIKLSTKVDRSHRVPEPLMVEPGDIIHEVGDYTDIYRVCQVSATLYLLISERDANRFEDMPFDICTVTLNTLYNRQWKVFVGKITHTCEKLY